VYNLTDT